ncbi:metal-dependent hydrolase [Candidatus Pacearchaeota archaeon]|nr:metal-dependent hydrolase [Candidatus Pacearchaeota archaeon]
MLVRTHFLFGIVLALFFLPLVTHPFWFVPLVLFTSLLPDVDSMHSLLGRSMWFRPFQWLTKHRGFLHSLTFCIIISFLLVLFFPLVAFPFFLGYTGHLLLDAFTVEGIRPWWPGKDEWKGSITTGSSMETGFFYGLILISLALGVVRFF